MLMIWLIELRAEIEGYKHEGYTRNELYLRKKRLDLLKNLESDS